jgi:16S rRNA (uracil1498-N3)-methyltransferase
MAAPRFRVHLPLAPAMAGTTIELPEAVAHHAVRVVRLAAGDALTLFTGEGGEFAATLVHVDKRGATARLDAFDAADRESPLAVTLAQAVVASDAMDTAIRKTVELGAAAIAPLVTRRSAPLPAGERGDKRLAHWRQIAVAACEQCGRNRIPEVAAPQPLAAFLDGWTGAGIVFAPESAMTLAALPLLSAPVAVVVGPEGGLEPAEVAAAVAHGFAAIRMGPRVLRADTAGAAALAALQTLAGDFQ